MTIKGKAYIEGIYEHPTRKADDKSIAHLHAESALGARAAAFGFRFGAAVMNQYAMAALRQMHESGNTRAELAWSKVSPSHHAQHNPHAMLREVFTVGDVVSSPMISDPLHRLDCCVISD